MHVTETGYAKGKMGFPAPPAPTVFQPTAWTVGAARAHAPGPVFRVESKRVKGNVNHSPLPVTTTTPLAHALAPISVMGPASANLSMGKHAQATVSVRVVIAWMGIAATRVAEVYA